MQILAITDGSKEALATIGLLNGYVDFQVQNLSNPKLVNPKHRPLVMLAFSRWTERLFDSLPRLLEAFGSSRRSCVLCMSLQDKAKLAHRLKSSAFNIASLSGARDELFRAVKEADPTIRLERKPQIFAAKTTQRLSNTFGSILGAQSKLAETYVDDIAAASDDVAQTIEDVGLEGWLASVAAHHSYTARHCMSVAGFAAQWATLLGFSSVDHDQFTQAALLHDIGKVAVPLAILDKPARLTDDERLEIEVHPVEGYRLLADHPNASLLIQSIARSHHEMLDGSGYPDGLTGRDISDPVRCSTIIDIYSALIDTRSYKAPIAPEKALEVLSSMAADGKLDPHLLDAFRPIVEMHDIALKASA